MSEYKPFVCLPMLALRGLVVFPGMTTHFDVGRIKSARAVEEAIRSDQQIFLVAQRELEDDDPGRDALYEFGTVSVIKQILRLPGDNMRILVEGKYRAQLVDCIQSEPYLFGRVMQVDFGTCNPSPARVQALVRQAHSLFEQFVDMSGKNAPESLLQVL